MDKYDREIEYLKQNPQHIDFAWNEPFALFSYITGDSTPHKTCGCLIQIKAGIASAPTNQLNDEIRNDSKIPNYPGQITTNHLEHFAQWQRKIDSMFPHRNTKAFLQGFDSQNHEEIGCEINCRVMRNEAER